MCVDGSTATPAVAPTAVEWATALGLDVHVAMAIHPLDTASPDHVLKAIASGIEAEGLCVSTDIIRSSYPAGALADLAETLDVGLVAMSSHARTGRGPIRARERDDGCRGDGPMPGPRRDDALVSATATGPAARAFRDALPITGTSDDYDALLELVGDRRFVLLGEASHGSHEFYRERARITQAAHRGEGLQRRRRRGRLARRLPRQPLRHGPVVGCRRHARAGRLRALPGVDVAQP